MKTEAIFDNIANRIEEQINLAEDKIFIAVAWFTNKNLFQALCKKASEGVKVKLVISDNEINRNSNINHSDIQIGKSKLYWIETHNKFCIIDDYVVITGSYNWSYKAENNLENIIICSGDNDLVKQFKKELKRIIKDYPQEDAIHPLLKRTEAEKSGNVKPNIPSSKFREYVTPPVIPSIKNDFESVMIGNQEWMLKNLAVDRFRNGDIIPEAKTKENWETAKQNKQPAWCYHSNDPNNGSIYGKLYNWYAVNDKRGLAPYDWHIPTEREWNMLLNYLGGDYSACKKLCSKERFFRDRISTNQSGFSALPGGMRGMDGNFEGLGIFARFWSNTEGIKDGAYCYPLRPLDRIERSNYFKFLYASVRCIKNL